MRDEKELAQAALELLKRAELKGGEVAVYVEVNNWLTSMVQGHDEEGRTTEEQ